VMFARRGDVMEIALWVAVLTGAVTAAGWAVNHVLSMRRDARTQQTADSLAHVDVQLRELYGPLAILVAEGERSFKDLTLALGRPYVFDGEGLLPDDELEVWKFWIQHEFFPRNERIKEIILANTHLIEGSSIPEAYLRFLDHYNSWRVNHLRWEKEGVEYGWTSKVNYPREFTTEILQTFQILKARQAGLLRRAGFDIAGNELKDATGSTSHGGT
jgi:hypothetical protein